MLNLQDKETTFIEGTVQSVGGGIITIRVSKPGDKLAHIKALPELLEIPRAEVLDGKDVEPGDSHGIEVRHSWIKKQPWWHLAGGPHVPQPPPASAPPAHPAARSDQLLTPDVSQLGAAFNHAALSLLETAMGLADDNEQLAAALLDAAAQKART